MTDDNTLRDVGQGDRDVDPDLQRAQRQAGGAGGNSGMPDFTSGPGYTGEIPPEGRSPDQGDWNAGADVDSASTPDTTP